VLLVLLAAAWFLAAHLAMSMLRASARSDEAHERLVAEMLSRRAATARHPVTDRDHDEQAPPGGRRATG